MSGEMLDLSGEPAAGAIAPGRVAAAPVRVAGATRPRAFLRALQTIHLWVGLILCLPIIAIGLSGSALLVQRQIQLYSMPAASASGTYQPLARMVEAAQSAVAPGIRPNQLELPLARGWPATVQFVVARQPVRTMAVYVDPVTLEVLGQEEVIRRGPVRDWLVTMHEFLMLPGHIGLPLVGWMAVTMTFMGVSGLILWWPRRGRWLGALRVARGARGMRLQLDLHRVVGFWGLAVFLILSLSGIYLAFPRTVSTGLRMALPSTQAHLVQDLGPVERVWPLSPDQAVAAAVKLAPNARPATVQLSVRDGVPLVVQLETQNFWPAIPPITVTFDPSNPDYVALDDPQKYTVGDRVLNVGYAMHFSLGMGWVWTLLVFLAGLLPLFLAVTGTTVWWMKRRVR
jgi:uncharacterized iron-regulated membrane protein